MRICLVGATHPAHNPRLIREADSLAEVGHDVRVVAPSFMADLKEKDKHLLETRRWRLQAVDFVPNGLKGTYRAYSARGRSRVFQNVFSLTRHIRYVERAYTPALEALTKLASDEAADWVIAHAHRALPVAAIAARKLNARLGFDCEDLLGQSKDSLPFLIEREYFGRCNYISVPSRSLGDELVSAHGRLPIIVLYNFFPTSLTKNMLPPNSRSRGDKLALYWFSQTIGEGRGIEDAVRAVGLLGYGAELHLRGEWGPGFEQKLTRLAAQVGVKLHIHPLLNHDELIAQMAEFDI